MFTQRKGRAEICNEPEFIVRYVGKAETFVATKKGCTHSIVQRIWDNSEEEHLLRRITVFISAAGITITDFEDKRMEERIDIKDISYCCAERPPHDRVFTWICKKKAAKKLECYVVLCATREKAQLMAMLLNKAFQIAYVDWKTQREKKARIKQQAATKKQERAAREHPRDISPSCLDDGGDQASTSSAGSSSEMSATIMSVNGLTVNGHNGDIGEGGEDDECDYSETMMAQMNIVEEDEISFSDNNITVEPPDMAKPKKVATWT